MNQDVLWGLIVVLSFAFVWAGARSLRMMLAKGRKEYEECSVDKVVNCEAYPTHNFPAAKRGRTVKCRFCPKTFTRR